MPSRRRSLSDKTKADASLAFALVSLGLAVICGCIFLIRHEIQILLATPAFASTFTPTPTLTPTSTLTPTATATPKPIPGILIFAPHPDDETLCCSTVIQQALEDGKRLHVIIITNGDGYPEAVAALTGKSFDDLQPADYLEMARVRQDETLAAVTTLGLQPADVTFLGYPDSGLSQVYETTGANPFQQVYTQKSETYGLSVLDYHSQVHGAPAPYRRDALTSDILEIIQSFEPEQVYVPNPVDAHPDHQASFQFVRDALQAISYQGETITYVVHASRPLCPEGLPCPAPITVKPTEAQAATKFQALLKYQSQVWQSFDSQDSLQAFSQHSEVFWPITLSAP